MIMAPNGLRVCEVAGNLVKSAQADCFLSQTSMKNEDIKMQIAKLVIVQHPIPLTPSHQGRGDIC